MTKSESIGKLAEALAKAQSAFAPIEKSKSAKVKMRSGGEYSFDYADLHAVLTAVTPALAANGLALLQDAETAPGAVKVSAWLLHSSGEWMQSSPVTVPVAVSQETGGSRPQEVGGAISYARRYVVSSLLSIASTEEDDDANAAEGNTATITPKARHAAPSPAGDVAIKFGKGKDKNLSALPDDDVRWYIGVWEKELTDPDKAKFHGKTRDSIAIAQAILASRVKSDGTPASKWDRVKAMAPQLADETLRIIVKDATGKTSAGALDEADFLALPAAIAAHTAGADIPY